MKRFNFFFSIKKGLLVILIGIILSSIFATKNLEKFDKLDDGYVTEFSTRVKSELEKAKADL